MTTPFQEAMDRLFDGQEPDIDDAAAYEQVAREVRGTDHDFAGFASWRPEIALKAFAPVFTSERLLAITRILCMGPDNPMESGTFARDLLNPKDPWLFNHLFGQCTSDSYTRFMCDLAVGNADVVYRYIVRVLTFRARASIDGGATTNRDWDDHLFIGTIPWLTTEQRDRIRWAVVGHPSTIDEAEMLVRHFTRKQAVRFLSDRKVTSNSASCLAAAAILLRDGMSEAEAVTQIGSVAGTPDYHRVAEHIRLRRDELSVPLMAHLQRGIPREPDLGRLGAPTIYMSVLCADKLMTDRTCAWRGSWCDIELRTLMVERGWRFAMLERDHSNLIATAQSLGRATSTLVLDTGTDGTSPIEGDTEIRLHAGDEIMYVPQVVERGVNTRVRVTAVRHPRFAPRDQRDRGVYPVLARSSTG